LHAILPGATYTFLRIRERRSDVPVPPDGPLAGEAPAVFSYLPTTTNDWPFGFGNTLNVV